MIEPELLKTLDSRCVCTLSSAMITTFEPDTYNRPDPGAR